MKIWSAPYSTATSPAGVIVPLPIAVAVIMQAKLAIIYESSNMRIVVVRRVGSSTFSKSPLQWVKRMPGGSSAVILTSSS